MEEMVDGSLTAPVEGIGYSSDDYKVMVSNILQSNGDMLQSRFIPMWKRTYPEVPLDYKTWGFAKLGDYFESISDVVETYRLPDQNGTYLRLRTGGETSNGHVESGAMTSSMMAGALTGVISNRTGVDPFAVEAFIKQRKLQFTIDCLVREFERFQMENPGGSTNGAGRGGARNARRPKNAEERNGAQPTAAGP